MTFFTVVGFRYRGVEAAVMETAQTITLEREPTNPVDPQAIKVLCDGVHVGYVVRDRCFAMGIVLEAAKGAYTVTVNHIGAASVTCCFNINKPTQQLIRPLRVPPPPPLRVDPTVIIRATDV